MKRDERENWIINIENTASTISSQVGSAVVDAVFQKYGAKIGNLFQTGIILRHFLSYFKIFRLTIQLICTNGTSYYLEYEI